MVRVATELRETLSYMLQVSTPDNPILCRLIDSYRDIAHELGQQSDVEHTLRDLLATAQGPHAGAAGSRHSSRKTSPSQTSRKAPSR